MSKYQDWRRFKVENILELKKIVEKNNGKDLKTILSIANIMPPYLCKKTALGYLKDMDKAGMIIIEKDGTVKYVDKN